LVYGGRPRPRPHCVRWGPTSPTERDTAASPTFRPMSIDCGQTVAHLSNCWGLVQTVAHKLCEHGKGVLGAVHTKHEYVRMRANTRVFTVMELIAKQWRRCLLWAYTRVRTAVGLNGPLYTVSQKKGATLTMAITLSILDRFAKFFHCCQEQ